MLGMALMWADVWGTPRPAHNDRVLQRAAASGGTTDWFPMKIFLLLQHITGRRCLFDGQSPGRIGTWRSPCALLSSHPGRGLWVETRERIPKMTSRLRWSKERLGRGEKKERSQSWGWIPRTEQNRGATRKAQQFTHDFWLACFCFRLTFRDVVLFFRAILKEAFAALVDERSESREGLRFLFASALQLGWRSPRRADGTPVLLSPLPTHSPSAASPPPKSVWRSKKTCATWCQPPSPRRKSAKWKSWGELCPRVSEVSVSNGTCFFSFFSNSSPLCVKSELRHKPPAAAASSPRDGVESVEENPH